MLQVGTGGVKMPLPWDLVHFLMGQLARQLTFEARVGYSLMDLVKARLCSQNRGVLMGMPIVGYPGSKSVL